MKEGGVFSQIGRGLSAARNFAANVLFLLLVTLLVVLVLAGSSGVSVPDGSALVINPRGVLVDTASITDPIERFLTLESVPRDVELKSLVKAITAGAADDRIALLVLNLEELQAASPGHADTLGVALREFQAAGKEVVSFGSFYSQGQYQIASYADAVYMHPLGQILLSGYGSNRIYYNELLEKLDVNIHIFRVGKYKEFVEPYTRSTMSDEARLANQELVDALWQHYADRIGANRQLDPGRFAAYTQDFAGLLAEAGGDMAALSLEYQLVDELLTPDETRARIADKVGYSDSGDFNGIDYRAYLQTIAPEPVQADAAIAVITATGPIVMGRRSSGVIATQSTIGLIRQARHDRSIAALVMRIDSPGGSAFASELIRQELELTQLAGKPVVVSMSNVAASGGYWIAATADQILAQPTTITGSIGVFGLLPTFEKSLAKLGVHTDGVATTPLSGSMDPIAGLSDPMSRILQVNVENTYERFINLVARGRDMTPQEVDAIAQGRVWIGAKAHELGLVDNLGGLDEAIAGAASLAKLTAYEVRELTPSMTTRELILRELSDSVALPNHPVTNALRQAWTLLESLDDPGHSYALCEACSVAEFLF